MSDLWRKSLKISIENYLFSVVIEGILAVKLHQHPDQRKYFGEADPKKITALTEFLDQLLGLAESKDGLYFSPKINLSELWIYEEFLQKLRQEYPNAEELERKLRRAKQLFCRYKKVGPKEHQELLGFLQQLKEILQAQVTSHGYFGQV